MQPVSACFAVDHLDGRGPHDPAPARLRRRPRYSLLAPDPRTNEPVAAHARRRTRPATPALIGPDLADPSLDKELWLFRRIAARGNFAPGHLRSDITLVNWPQIDYTGGPVFGVPDAAAPRRRRARAEPRLPALAADRGAASPGCGCAATSSATRRTGSRRRSTSASRGGSAASTTRSLEHGARPRRTRTASGSARTGSTCTPRPAATRTSTSPARRSRSRSAR